MPESIKKNLLHEDLVGRAQEQQENKEAPSMSAIAFSLNAVFSDLNHLVINYDKSLEKSFVIEIDKESKAQSFRRRVFHTPNIGDQEATYSSRKPEILPVFNIDVTFGKNFNVVSDLPKLISEIQRVHNLKMEEYGQSEPMVFINTSKQLAEFWQFMAGKLAQFAKKYEDDLKQIPALNVPTDNEVGIDPITSKILEYVQLCSLISSGFKQSDDQDLSKLAQEVDSSALLNLEWDTLEKNLEKAVGQIIKRSKLNNSDINFTELISRFLQSITNTAQKDILNQLNTQSRAAFFNHCEAELYRKTGLPTLLKRITKNDDVSEVVKQQLGEKHWFAKWIKDNFPENQRELDNLSRNLNRNKLKLIDEREKNDTNKIEALILVRTSLQEELAEKLCAIIYSEKLFIGKDTSYFFSDAIEKNQVNCMMRSELLHQLWKKYCGETTLAAAVKSHIFSVVELADGSLLKLEHNPTLFTKDGSVYDFGDHARLYQVAICDWKGNEYKQSGNSIEAEALFKEAMRLSPNNPGFKYNLAILLATDSSRYSEAEKLYREAIQLSPNNPDYK